MACVPMKSIFAIAEEYAAWEPNANNAAAVRELIKNHKDEELASMFLPRIAFGTAGLRARMAPGYHYMNELVVVQASQGLCRYLEKQFTQFKQRGFLIGYDGRYNSLTYARLVAQVFLSQGVKTYLFNKIVATPFVSFGVKLLGCCGGVMVTASHNPKEDNGYKVFWENSAQIIQPHDIGISEQIEANLKPWHSYSTALEGPVTFDGRGVEDPTDQVINSYYDKITAYHYSADGVNGSSKFPVTYTAMHGVGAPYTARALEVFGLPKYIPVVKQVEVDPEFPTVKFPNPEEGKGALALSIETANASGSTLILANDPDADRLAIAERVRGSPDQWNILNGNEIALLFADYVWRSWRARHPHADPSKCVMISSTVSSKALKAMAAKEGFLFLGTLTGFKWMGNVAADFIAKGYTFLFAYEVEIGFLTGDISLDKDGVRMAALFNELALDLYNKPMAQDAASVGNGLDKRGVTCIEHLESLYRHYGYFYMNTSYFFCSQLSIFDEIFQRLRHYKEHGPADESKCIVVGANSYPRFCGVHEIASVRDISAGIDTSKAGQRSVLPLVTDAFMISMRFVNGCVATMRNSGTEPKLKYYIECSSMNSREEAEKLTKEMSKAIIEEFIQPMKYMLKAQGEK